MRKIIIALFLSVLCSCGDRDAKPDANYGAVRSPGGVERLEKFKKFPLTERFRLYNKIYKNSGHPHDVELSFGFRDDPEDALNYIINDLHSSRYGDFLKYLPIIDILGNEPNVDICRRDRIQSLRTIIANYRLNEQELTILKGLRFNRCELIA